MKLYQQAQAARSIVQQGTEVVDDFLTIMADPLGARETMERHVDVVGMLRSGGRHDPDTAYSGPDFLSFPTP